MIKKLTPIKILMQENIQKPAVSTVNTNILKTNVFDVKRTNN